MRRSGACLEAVGMQPCDHIGWVYSGREQYTALALAFLSEGAALGEKLIYVAEDPEPGGPGGLAESVDPGSLEVMSITEVYGRSGMVDARAQHATFNAALAAAKSAGFTGIRVAADNTPLVTGDRRFRAWLGWELLADRFMAANPVTGLCAFDRDRVSVDQLRHLATLHPLSSARDPRPQFRMFVDEQVLRVEGILDVFAVRTLARALQDVPGYRGVEIDLRTGSVFGPATARKLDGLTRAGVEVTVTGDEEAIRDFVRVLPAHSRIALLEPRAEQIAKV